MYTLMLVEDEPLIRAGLKKYFDWPALGVTTIIEAENGRRGVELSLQEKPDFIITDIRMPLMDGLEMIKQIRLKQPTMPFIILTGHNEFEYAQKAIQYGGVQDFLLKPLQRETSYEAITNCIQTLQDVHAPTQASKPMTPTDGGSQVDEFDLFKQMEKYIIHHIHGDVSLHHVAEQFFYNPSYLSRLFKLKLNMNYVDFVNGIKIKLAQELLQKPRLTIADVSTKSGFNSYKHFVKTFRNVTNMTPTDFRKQIRA
jgi:YesN/AraC family two-component response regulator